MQLSRVDLNLFTIFDAIYRDGGITPASKRLHLSQPAVSHALARLRELLDDPLFERRGHDMVPTPLARSIAANVTASLGGLEQLLQRTGRFDPGTSPRSFTIAMREVNELPFLPVLVERLQREAPHVDICVVRIDRRDLEEDLQSGEIDFAFDVGLPLSHDVRRERVTAEPLAVLARKDHPSIQGALPLDSYLTMEHILITGRRRGGGYEDIVLGRLGMSRRIRVRCQHYAAACAMVARSDLLATMARSQALVSSREGDPRWARDHPAVTAALGVLPGPGIDMETMRRSLHWILGHWDWPSTWGWDYPMVAMTAARLGEPARAIDALLLDTPKNRFRANGHNHQRPGLTIYLPGNGGLLTAVAMMAGGWDGAPSRHAPGFPDDGSWTVRSEGLRPMP
jgi:DNA-binding transcriptional LysR family regulator